MARPNKYATHVEPRLELVKSLAEQGCTNREIAHALGIGLTAFHEYKAKFTEFADAIDTARLSGIVEVKKALFKKATGYEYEEKKTYIKRDEDGRENKYTEVVKRYSQPDMTAISMYLRNYDTEWIETDRISNELKKMELELRKEMLKEE